MLKAFRERFTEFFQRQDPPANDFCTLHQIATDFPQAFTFIERKYGVPVGLEDSPLTLSAFCEKYGLPPAPVLFMEIQMQTRSPQVQELTVQASDKLLKSGTVTKLLDVREDWEIKLCKLPNSQQLSAPLLDEMLGEWPKETPILIYCHHGVRSMDAAIFLADRGFTSVMSMKGGIDAWSVQIDPTVPRYDGQYC